MTMRCPCSRFKILTYIEEASVKKLHVVCERWWLHVANAGYLEVGKQAITVSVNLFVKYFANYNATKKQMQENLQNTL